MSLTRSATSATEPLPRTRWLVAIALAPIIVLVLLRMMEIPLGWTGKFTYRYSPWYLLRLLNAVTLVIPAALFAVGVVLVSDVRRARRFGGHALCLAGLIATCVWIWFAPPTHLFQHVLNFFSPSHDGAFVVEAFTFENAKEYLAAFPQRAATPPATMKGTRVISNPPGTTLLAYGVRRLLEHQSWLGQSFDQYLINAGVEQPLIRRQMAVGIVLAWVLLGLTCAGAVCLYAVVARCLPSSTAWMVTIVSVTSPAMLLFSPGKDPAQLLTVALPLLCWLAALQRGGVLLGLLAGGAFGVGLLTGLVHVWIASIVLGATVLAATPDDRGRIWRLCVLALVGLIVFAVAARFAALIDLIAISRAVAAAQSRVTRGPDAMSWFAQTLGLLLFPLFAGAALPAFACVAWRHSPQASIAAPGAPIAQRAAWAGWLLVLTIIVMLATIGFTNVETPRLWIPFATLLTLGAALRIPTLRDPSPAMIRQLAVLIFIHVISSAVIWSMMDMREAEMRLLSGRILN